MFDFPDVVGIPLAKWIDCAMDWLLLHLSGFFDAVGFVILQVVMGVEKLFLFVPWFILIPLVGLAGWKLVGKWKTGVVFMTLMFIIGTFGYWELAMRTLSLVIASVFFSLLIGIPTGINMARNDRSEILLKPLLDGMQTMPSFVYLIPALMFFGMGKVPAMFATIIYAVPPVIRLTCSTASGKTLYYGGDQPDNHDGSCNGGYGIHDWGQRPWYGSSSGD